MADNDVVGRGELAAQAREPGGSVDSQPRSRPRMVANRLVDHLRYDRLVVDVPARLIHHRAMASDARSSSYIVPIIAELLSPRRHPTSNGSSEGAEGLLTCRVQRPDQGPSSSINLETATTLGLDSARRRCSPAPTR